MKDNQNLIQKIKEQADIVDIINEYVHLEKKGNDYVGLCPFHDDKNPSMHVSPTKKIFKCFSCNEAGDVIGFVKKIKKISSFEAAREVGEKIGIHFELTEAEKEKLKNQKYYDIIEEATNFYNFYLKNTYEGEKGLEYLRSRGIDLDIINHFRIGLASKDRNLLYKALLEKGYLQLDMIEVGLLAGKDKDIDMFRNRIIFPLTNLDGEVVGFSGRKYLENDSEVKYINSSENVIFKKGNILYNFDKAIEHIKSENGVILFEGFMDVIAAYRSGVYNIVASMGTALTLNQVQAIQRFTDTITICYDGDTPGIEATKKAIDILLKQNMNVAIVSIPEGLDPDEYLQKYGPEKLKNILLKARTNAIDYIYETELKKLIPSDIFSSETFKNNVFRILNYFDSNLVYEKVLKKMSEDLAVNYETLEKDFITHKTVNTRINKFLTPSKSKKIKGKTKFLKYKQIQKELVCIAIKHPEKLIEIENKFQFKYDNEYREIMLMALECYSEEKKLNFSMIKSKLSEEPSKIFDELLNMDISDYEKKIDILFSEFNKYAAVKKIEELRNKEEKTIEDTENIRDSKRNTVKIIFDGGNSNATGQSGSNRDNKRR